MTTTHIKVNIKAYSAESAPSAPCHNLVKNFLMSLLLRIPPITDGVCFLNVCCRLEPPHPFPHRC